MIKAIEKNRIKEIENSGGDCYFICSGHVGLCDKEIIDYFEES